MARPFSSAYLSRRRLPASNGFTALLHHFPCIWNSSPSASACQTLLLGLVGRSRGGYRNGDQTKRQHSGRSRLNDILSGSLLEAWWFPNPGLLHSIERVSSLPCGLCHFVYPVPPRHWPRGEGRPVPAHRRVWAPAALRFQVALIWVLAPESDPGVVPGETQHKLSNNLGKDFPSRDS